MERNKKMKITWWDRLICRLTGESLEDRIREKRGKEFQRFVTESYLECLEGVIEANFAGETEIKVTVKKSVSAPVLTRLRADGFSAKIENPDWFEEGCNIVISWD